MFLWSNNELAIKQQDEKLKTKNSDTTITVVDADPEIISIYHETSAEDSSSGACVSTCSGVSLNKLGWGISVDRLSDIHLVLNVFGQGHGVKFAWSIPL